MSQPQMFYILDKFVFLKTRQSSFGLVETGWDPVIRSVAIATTKATYNPAQPTAASSGRYTAVNLVMFLEMPSKFGHIL